MKTAYERILSKSKKENRIFVKKSFDLADKLHAALEALNMSQKEFAKKLGKNESEISKWLSGQHNFTIKSISKIEAVLNVELLNIKPELDKFSNFKQKVQFVKFYRKIKSVDETIKIDFIPKKVSYHQKPTDSDWHPLKVA